MRAIDDDELSHRSGSLSRTSSSKSFSANFSVDWDEIDSIAEESLSVASSASSGHRKRTRRRTPVSTVSQLDALESGSLSRYTNGGHGMNHGMSGHSNHNGHNGHGHNGHNHNTAGSRGSGSLSRDSTSGSAGPHRPKQQTPSKQQQRKQRRQITQINMSMFQDAKRLATIGLLVITCILSIHFCGSYLKQIVTFPLQYQYPTTMNMNMNMNMNMGNMGADRSARRALSRSNAIYATRKWPLSVRDEQADFEFMPHPANDKVTLSLPRFFLTRDDGTMDTLGRVKSISKTMTNLVGRTTVDGSRDFSVRTIFISIPNFRDNWHCRYTIESIFKRAKYPERIRLGVVDQLQLNQDQSCDLPIVSCAENPNQALCQYRQQIDVYEMDSKLAVGPTFARHISHRMYRGEYYALQIHAHTTFTKNWDVELIEQWEETTNEMAVLTTYLDDAVGSIDDQTGISNKKSRLVLCNAAYEGAGHDRRLRHDYHEQPDMLPGISGMPQLQPYWSSSFSFSRGHFILTVPYDPYLPMIRKADEEISMALRAFTHGYDFYTPLKSVAYDSAFSDDKDSLKSFLDHESLYKGMAKLSLQRLDGLVGMSDDDNWINDPNEIFGIGQARTLQKFHTSFGVHPREKITERKLCNFVSTGRMHKQFIPKLREDGMGLNYDQINFRFHELQNNHDA